MHEYSTGELHTCPLSRLPSASSAQPCPEWKETSGGSLPASRLLVPPNQLGGALRLEDLGGSPHAPPSAGMAEDPSACCSWPTSLAPGPPPAPPAGRKYSVGSKRVETDFVGRLGP